MADFRPPLDVGALSQNPVYGIPGEIRVIWHPSECERHMIIDPHWVEVYTGLSFIEWHHNIFEHLRKGSGRR